MDLIRRLLVRQAEAEDGHSVDTAPIESVGNLSREVLVEVEAEDYSPKLRRIRSSISSGYAS